MFCNKCGKPIENNNGYCSNCGEQIINANQNFNIQEMDNSTSNSVNNSANNTSYKSKNSNGNKKIILIIVIVIVSILVLIGILFSASYIIKQIKLNMVDKQLQEEAKKINDSFNTSIDNNNSEITAIKKYNVGDTVYLLDDSKWYVVKQDDKMITLLSSSNYGDKTYFGYNADNYYSGSKVEGIIKDKFLPELKSSLLKSNGNVTSMTARILSTDDIKEIINSTKPDPKGIEISKTYSWLFNTGSYWTMTTTKSNVNTSVYIVESWGDFATISEDLGGLTTLSSGKQYYVRPLVTLSIDNIK